jgi:glycosyltransferase involved in cell wall biosynthesis
MSQPALYIIGTRGVPAAHGGFETFAHRFALHMRDKGWRVTVYCQVDEGPAGPVIDEWEGVRRVTFCADSGAFGTMTFDWACVRHAMSERGVMLVLGYNTAIFSALLRLTPNPVLTNMDGIEWKRAKWPWHGRIWLYLNEWIGALTSNKLIADHPEIANHLARRRSRRDIVMIPYGADPVTQAPEAPVRAMGLTPGRYLISIGRVEPENNILPMIEAFASKPRDLQFVCLGKLDPDNNAYQAEVLKAGEGRVLFPGAIYDPAIVQALRFHAASYCHGHSVGGTNPSLVEALGAGNAVIGHDNLYNRWVAGADQFYFADAVGFEAILERIEGQPELLVAAGQAARRRFDSALTWGPVLEAYEEACRAALNPGASSGPSPNPAWTA